MLSREEALVEELFKGCKKTLRILRLFIINPNKSFTKYKIEKEALVYDSEIILERLVKLGIVEILSDDPKLYRLKNEIPLVKALKTFLKEIGYL